MANAPIGSHRHFVRPCVACASPVTLVVYRIHRRDGLEGRLGVRCAAREVQTWYIRSHIVDFSKQLLGAFATLGLPLSEHHRVHPEELEEAERRLGLPLPAVLRQYYLVAGRHPLNLALNELRAPSELSVEGDVLVFMDENQGVVLWGIAGSSLALEDPQVLQASTGAELRWYPEDDSLKNFLLLMMHWQAVSGGLPFLASCSAQSFDLGVGWDLCAQAHEMTAYSRPGAALCVVRENDQAHLYLGALDASAFEAASEELDVNWDYSPLNEVPKVILN
jgi:hypothetical protein